MRKKLSAVIGVVLAISLTGCGSKLSDEILVNYAETQGIDCLDETEGYTPIDGMTQVCSVTDENVYIELWEFESKNSATSWKSKFETSLSSTEDAKSIDGGYEIWGDYYKIVQSGSNCIYLRGSTQNDVETALETLGIK